ncbi:MAG TPA: SRPBCC domain-containing protein [Anaeromyxobacter sp.]|nr:SRPBCC domain-containing protein [Anaeromyxobacter sp.]
MAPLVVELSLDIDAPPSRVWRVLTDPAVTPRYMFGCAAITDWKIGHPLLWRARREGKERIYVKGTVLGFEPERLLQYTTIGVGMGIDDAPRNYLTVTHRLTPLPGGRTRLDITQGDFAAADDGPKRHREAITNWRHTAERLKAVAEEGDVEQVPVL